MVEKINKTGIELITEERQRQIDQEGWSSQHDDQWTNFELSRAACAYLNSSSSELIERFWPVTWRWTWWKPKDRIRDYVRAGALIAAEIDRLQRTPDKY